MKTILSITLFFCLCACNSSDQIKAKDGEVRSAIAAEEQSDEELKAELEKIRKEEEEAEKRLAATRTSMSFDKLVHDFGTIKADTDNKATFIVTNTGNNPLILEDVSASCGCTTAEKPEKPILPGKSDKISVVFHPNSGQLNEQKKSITITANTEPKVAMLEIKGFVKP
jgi:ATPase subunit of ABC transporter with duplicated ATPase domains